MPLPSIGLTIPVRVCDRCYFDIDGNVGSPTLTQSLMNNLENVTISEQGDEEKFPQRQRQRRSAVVDELAAKVKQSSDPLS